MTLLFACAPDRPEYRTAMEARFQGDRRSVAARAPAPSGAAARQCTQSCSPRIPCVGVRSTARRMAEKFQPHSRLVDCHVFQIVARREFSNEIDDRTYCRIVMPPGGTGRDHRIDLPARHRGAEQKFLVTQARAKTVRNRLEARHFGLGA